MRFTISLCHVFVLNGCLFIWTCVGNIKKLALWPTGYNCSQMGTICVDCPQITAMVLLRLGSVGQVVWPAQMPTDPVIPPARTSCRARPRSPSVRIMKRCSSHRCCRGSWCHWRWRRYPGRTGVRSTSHGRCCPRRTSAKIVSFIRQVQNIGSFFEWDSTNGLQSSFWVSMVIMGCINASNFSWELQSV